MPKTSPIQDRIEQLMEEHGSLRAVAERVGLSWPYLHRLRRGEQNSPSDETLAKLGLRREVTVVYHPLRRRG